VRTSQRGAKKPQNKNVSAFPTLFKLQRHPTVLSASNLPVVKNLASNKVQQDVSYLSNWKFRKILVSMVLLCEKNLTKYDLAISFQAYCSDLKALENNGMFKTCWEVLPTAASRGGAKGFQGGHCPPPKILPGPPKIFQSSSESPTQTIDSSPCCKTGPSSGPPK